RLAGKEQHARSPLVVPRHLVVEAENVGAVTDERGGVLEIGKVTRENRPHRLEVEAARQLESLHLQVRFHRYGSIPFLDRTEAVALVQAREPFLGAEADRGMPVTTRSLE